MMHIEGFFDPATWTVTYLIADDSTGDCAVIDSVLDFDPKSGRTSTTSADSLIAHIRERGWTLQWLLETHVHADHMTASAYIKQVLGGKTAVGAGITRIQQVFGSLFNEGADFARDGSQFDRLLADNETLGIGTLTLTALHTPGHTPACMSYLVSDGQAQAVFVGDTLFMPDYGTARCDFPGGDARTLYQSVQRLLALPPETRLYMCHDYQPGGRPLEYISTVADERAHNIHVRAGISEDEFVTMRQTRDAGLSMPALLLPSVQVNMRAGELPVAEANGVQYLKIPLNAV